MNPHPAKRIRPQSQSLKRARRNIVNTPNQFKNKPL